MVDLISVIVPIYNTGERLKGCIESILAQDYPNIEIILVDDGSTDGTTLSILKKYENKDNIVIIHQINGGLSVARNTGIENAKGKYVAFVDSDDLIERDSYSRLHVVATKHEVPLVLGGIKKDDSDALFCDSGLEDGIYSNIEILSKFLQGSWHSACSNLYSKSLIGDIRFPPKEINEDYIFNFKILCKTTEIFILNYPFYHYIKSDNSITTSPAKLKHLDYIRHTEFIKQEVFENYNKELADEAEFQYIFANIVLANKSIMSMAKGFTEEPKQLYKICTRNLEKIKQEVYRNPFLSKKYRISATGLIFFPYLYRTLITTFLKLKR
ncbi:MAG: glycosyltransferase [Muribaculaceae bacterium]|nr:glycosyltransferase [Muribaculaceae bacterium]